VRLIGSDPVEFFHRYTAPVDKEIAGFLASQFAYGKIDVMKRFLGSLFEVIDPSPADFLRRGDPAKLDGLYYRFQKSAEIKLLFAVLGKILKEYGSIGDLLKTGYGGDIRETLWGLRERLRLRDNDLIFFFPKRLPANPLKRWNLYLRWMVRKDEIDQGLWDFIDKKDLVVPLDTHLFKIGRCLGWTKRKSPSWNAAQDITKALKDFSPEDPLKYDLFLCHKVGIEAGCGGARTEDCARKCVLTV
jgi:uncharacterized protein (TIGR02757 family)